MNKLLSCRNSLDKSLSAAMKDVVVMSTPHLRTLEYRIHSSVSLSDNYVSVRRPEQDLKRLDRVATGKVGANYRRRVGQLLLTEDSYHGKRGRGWEPKVSLSDGKKLDWTNCIQIMQNRCLILTILNKVGGTMFMSLSRFVQPCRCNMNQTISGLCKRQPALYVL